MANFRLGKYKEIVLGVQNGDPTAQETLRRLQAEDPSLIQQLDGELTQQTRLESADPVDRSAPPPPAQPPGAAAGAALGQSLSTPAPTSTTTTAPPTTTTLDNTSPPWMSGTGSIPPDQTTPPWMGTGTGPMEGVGQRVLRKLSGSEPRPPAASFSEGVSDRLTESWNAAQADVGLGPDADPNQPGIPIPLGGDPYSASSTSPASVNPNATTGGRMLSTALAGADMGYRTLRDLASQGVESWFSTNKDGTPNLNAAQYGDIASRGFDVAAVTAGLNHLGKMAYNNWPRGLRKRVLDYDRANAAYDAAIATHAADRTAAQAARTAQVNQSRTARHLARANQRTAVQGAETAHMTAAERAVEGAQRTLDEAKVNLARDLARTQPSPRFSERIFTLQESGEPRGRGGVGPPSRRQLEDASWIDPTYEQIPDPAGGPPTRGRMINAGSTGPITRADVFGDNPQLAPRRAVAQAHGHRVGRAEDFFARAEAAGNPRQAQVALRRGYEQLERAYPQLARDPTWQQLLQRADAVTAARAPLPPSPTIPPVPTVPKPRLAVEGRGARPERPTYGQARNRLIGRSVGLGAKAGGLGALGIGAGIATMGLTELVKTFRQVADALHKQTSSAVSP